MGALVELPVAATRTRKALTLREEKAARALPQFPHRYISPEIRAKANDARAMLEMETSAALVIATAMFETMDEAQKVRVQLKASRFAGTPAGRSACAWLRRLAGANEVEGLQLKAAMGLVEIGRL